MATVANHITDIQNLVRFLEERATSFAAEATDADTIVSSKAADLDGSIESLWSDDGQESYRRQTLSQATQTLATRGFSTIAGLLAKTLNRGDLPPGTDPTLVYGIGLRDYMIANSKVFKARGVTNSAPTMATANTGNGTIVMIASDDQASAVSLENVNVETLTFTARFVAGQGTVQSGNTVFEVRGGLPYRDIHENGGSGGSVIATIAAACATQSNFQPLGNTDFDATFGSTASATDKIPSWTIASGTAADVTYDTSVYYRKIRGTSAGQSLSFAAGSFTLTQRASELPAYGPVYIGIRWMRKSSATGDLTITLGASATSTVDISTGTNDVWNLLGGWFYPAKYTGGSQTFTITVASLATGTLRLDDLVLVTPYWIGGKGFAILEGSTDFVIGDNGSQVTTAADSGTILKWMYRAHRPSWGGLVRNFPFNLPTAATASAGYTDP